MNRVSYPCFHSNHLDCGMSNPEGKPCECSCHYADEHAVKQMQIWHPEFRVHHAEARNWLASYKAAIPAMKKRNNPWSWQNYRVEAWAQDGSVIAHNYYNKQKSALACISDLKHNPDVMAISLHCYKPRVLRGVYARNSTWVRAPQQKRFDVSHY